MIHRHALHKKDTSRRPHQKPVQPPEQVPEQVPEEDERPTSSSGSSNPADPNEKTRGYRLTQAHDPNLRFQIKSFTQEEEDKIDIAALRPPNRCGVMASTLNLAKCALGTGILKGHVAYMYAGYLTATIMNLGFGIYMAYCFYLVGTSAQMLYRRCHLGGMSYPDLGEAAVGLFPNPKLSRFSSIFRHFIALLICVNLFGSCVCYQLFLGKTVKQLVENSTAFDVKGSEYGALRFYVSILILPFILLCLIPTLKYLAPFAMAGLTVVVFYVIMAIYYGLANNPRFERMVPVTDLDSQVHYVGIAVLSMSCAGLLLPVENNMEEPHKFKDVIIYTHIIIILAIFLSAFFGYVGYLDKCMEPLTMDFPQTTMSSVLKVSLGIMIYVTHALNYFLPFNTLFYYVKKFLDPTNYYKYEIFYRGFFVVILWMFALALPSSDSLLYFLSSVCICQTALIFPNIIYLLVCWERPGLGKYSWRLWRAIIFICIGCFVLFSEIIVFSYDIMTEHWLRAFAELTGHYIRLRIVRRR